MTDSNGTATIPAIVRERVAQGLAWIIEHGAEHGVDLDRVDLDTLDLQSSVDCVLGQGHGGTDDDDGYHAVLTSVFGDHWDWHDEYSRWVMDHGFVADYEANVSAEHLAAAWRQAITVHRGQS